MTQLEKDLEAKLRKEVQKRGGLCLKWVCPGWSGVPDRIILLPGGRIHFVEMKRPKGGRLSAMQLWWAKTLTGLGFCPWIIWKQRDLEEFLQYIEKETKT
jgi:hypothetical protein